MRELRLLERISNQGKSPTDQGIDEKTAVLDSIVGYLIKALNTRQGSVPIDVEFGVPHYSSMAARFSTDMSGSTSDIEHGIKTAIQKAEPRLTAVRVRLLDKSEVEIDLTLSVRAKVQLGEEKVPVELKVVISANGDIQISM